MTDQLADTLKDFTACIAAVVTAYSIAVTPDINLFYSNYFAGLTTGVAMFMWLDDTDD